MAGTRLLASAVLESVVNEARSMLVSSAPLHGAGDWHASTFLPFLGCSWLQLASALLVAKTVMQSLIAAHCGAEFNYLSDQHMLSSEC